MNTNNEHFPIDENYANPFKHPALREASVFALIKDLFQQKQRPFDCLQVEVTSFCSAKCTYCPHTTKIDTWQSRHMQAHTFANLWPLLQQVTRVHLQGWGEPLLNPYFFEFVALARKAGCLVSSTSCGLHFNEEIANKVVKSGMDIVAFSFAGTDEESNSPRKGADFNKVCQSIKLLQKVRKERMAVHLELHLAYILLADRLEAVKNLPHLMQELDVHASVVSTLDYLAEESQKDLAINPNDTEIIQKAKEILQNAALEAEKNDKKIYYALPSLTPSPECRENIQKALYVDAAGTIAPCIYLNVPYEDVNSSSCLSFGNVNTENILDIWQKKDFIAFREAHANNKPVKQCKNCVKKFENLV